MTKYRMPMYGASGDLVSYFEFQVNEDKPQGWRAMAIKWVNDRRVMTVDTRRGLIAVAVLMVISAVVGAVVF